ncbi:hypothetical protein [Bradyrhizobium sp. CCBAU 51753]|uniref:hypothetical protein n=1 Tax=Bradyrhizobium sp. CCBAU 51753 TaxID=1325100 RepID=UPI001889FB82|nr:hypothetical protein [Bradyrhizobium sp. CCBAU 51753]
MRYSAESVFCSANIDYPRTSFLVFVFLVDQDYISGLISVFDAGVLTAQGQEGGPFFDFNRNKSGFAPDVQVGYMHPFAGGDWVAGLKFNYKYANIDSKQNVIIPQNGTGTVVSGPNAGISGPITGFLAISPAEINLRHQLSLIGTIGRAFGDVTIYAGGGPALFGVESNFINGIPFATQSLRGTFRHQPADHRIQSKLGVGRRGANWYDLFLCRRLVPGFCLHLCAFRGLRHLQHGHRIQPERDVVDLRVCRLERPRAGHQPVRDANTQLSIPLI